MGDDLVMKTFPVLFQEHFSTLRSKPNELDCLQDPNLSWPNAGTPSPSTVVPAKKKQNNRGTRPLTPILEETEEPDFREISQTKEEYDSEPIHVARGSDDFCPFKHTDWRHALLQPPEAYLSTDTQSLPNYPICHPMASRIEATTPQGTQPVSQIPTQALLLCNDILSTKCRSSGSTLADKAQPSLLLSGGKAFPPAAATLHREEDLSPSELLWGDGSIL